MLPNALLILSLISQLSNENIVIFIRHNKTLKIIQISAKLIRYKCAWTLKIFMSSHREYFPIILQDVVKNVVISLKYFISSFVFLYVSV